MTIGRTVIVSNRIPRASDRGISQGGLLVGLGSAFADGDLWFGWTGRFDQDPSRMTHVSNVGRRCVAGIDLGREEYEHYYLGYANRVLWPLFHFRLGLIEYRSEYAESYAAVNQRFASALAPMLQPNDVIWINDYHLIPLGKALRSIGCGNRLGFFLHTPFVPPAMLRVLPNAEQLLAWMCDYDVVGFQTTEHLRDFLDCTKHILGFATSNVGVEAPRRTVQVIAVPVGIDALRFAGEAQKAQKTGESRRLVSSMAGRSLIIGVDRLDYSKGLLNRFEGYSRFLRGHPEFKNKVSYLQIAPKSREEVDEYRSLKRDLDRMVGHINGLFSEFDWTPIRYLTRPVPRTAIAGFYRTARIGLVTPLRDGMNLVAKEFVAAQDPEDPGVLVLSRFAGAADELQDALLVNPFDPDDIAEKIRMALQLDRHDRRVRHCKLLKAVTFNSDERFCRTFLGLLRGEGDRIPTGACGLDFAPIVMRLAEFHWPKQVATWRRLIPPKLAVN